MKIPLKLLTWLGAAGAAAAIGFVASNEGTVYETYRDSVGVLTACTGETAYIAVPGDIKPGKKFTKEQCDTAFMRSLEKRIAPIQRCTNYAKLTNGQKIAFLDFTYNVGETAFCNSKLAKYASQGMTEASCAQFDKWVYAGGRDCTKPANKHICGGIATRRGREYDWCMQ